MDSLVLLDEVERKYNIFSLEQRKIKSIMYNSSITNNHVSVLIYDIFIFHQLYLNQYFIRMTVIYQFQIYQLKKRRTLEKKNRYTS